MTPQDRARRQILVYLDLALPWLLAAAAVAVVWLLLDYWDPTT